MTRIKKGFFITGTDTNIGKTFIACKLLNNLKRQGYKTVALKPIASGCIATSSGWQNSDAIALQNAATEKLSYQHINPFAFPEPIAPHIAAKINSQTLSINKIINACQPALTTCADYIIIEGAGGWSVPLNEDETMADLAKALKYPIILVVGMRLGCLNHALLTYHHMQQTGVQIHGWIANCLEPDMPYLTENIETLELMLDIPLIRLSS